MVFQESGWLFLLLWFLLPRFFVCLTFFSCFFVDNIVGARFILLKILVFRRLSIIWCRLAPLLSWNLFLLVTICRTRSFPYIRVLFRLLTLLLPGLIIRLLYKCIVLLLLMRIVFWGIIILLIILQLFKLVRVHLVVSKGWNSTKALEILLLLLLSREFALCWLHVAGQVLRLLLRLLIHISVTLLIGFRSKVIIQSSRLWSIDSSRYVVTLCLLWCHVVG